MSLTPFRIVKAYLIKLAYDFSSVQFDFPQDFALDIITWGKKNIPDTILKSSEGDPPGFTGREDEIHVTIKYGLHTCDYTQLQSLLKDQEPFKITLGKIDTFEHEDEDVIKINVEKTPELMQLNQLISKSFEITDSYPDYKPHVTLAYVKKGEGKKYKGLNAFGGKEVLVDGVTFSGKDNKKTLLKLCPTEERPLVIAVDFDGTIVELNEDVTSPFFTLKPNAKEVLDWMHRSGFYIIIWTVRTGELQRIATSFLDKNEIKYHIVNQNAPFLHFPTSRKIFFDYCIDDHCCFEDEINWLKVKRFLTKFLSAPRP